MKGFNDMTEKELMDYALQIGCEDFVVLDNEGGLANRAELVDVIIQCELNGMEWDGEWDADELDPAGGHGLYSHI